ncbi:MAG: sigma-70 family RNA polymerase sigma factor [Myxococcales bacterium]
MADAMRPTFQAVYQAEFTYVWNTLRRLGVRSADLQDVAHDVFVIAYRRFEEYDATRPVRPWLFGIAFRVVAHLRRDEKTKPAPTESVSVDELFSNEPGPEEQAQVSRDRELVAAALDALDFDKRAVFVLHELDGCPVPEIARELLHPAEHGVLAPAAGPARLRRGREAAAGQAGRGSAMNGPVDTKLDPLPPEIEDLLDDERQAMVVPPFGAEEAVLASVMATVGTGAAGAATAAAASAGSTSSSAAGSAAGSAASGAVQTSLAAKLVSGAVLFAVGSVAGAGGHALYQSHFVPPPAPIVQIVQVPAPPPAPTPAPAEAVPASPVAALPPAPAAAVAPPRRALPEPRPAAAHTSDTALAAERSVLEVARMALVRGQADGAIAELEKHARAFPKGQLVEEREVLLVHALVTAGRYGEARTRGKQFAERYPASMLLPVVQEALKSIP